MIDYNDGKWHGWNGGECPVHPDSVVECVIMDRIDGYPSNSLGAAKAREYTWNHDQDTPIIAFRVIKPYVEPPKPREVYVAFDKNGRVEDAGVYYTVLSDYGYHEVVKFREVLE